MERDDPAYKGQAGYNPFLLAIYDPFVLGFMARAVWRCPTPPVVERYRRHLGRRHLDVGPGTGYFIEKAAPPAGTEITLLDPNPNVLARCSRRLAAMHPTTVQADVMKPLPVDGPFDSAALNFVLHCLRGPQSHKAHRDPERGRRARTRWRDVRRHRLGNRRITYTTGSRDPPGLQPEGRLRQPRGYRRGAPPDPGGVLPDGRGRRDRIGRTLHCHWPGRGWVTRQFSTTGIPTRCRWFRSRAATHACDPRPPRPPLARRGGRTRRSRSGWVMKRDRGMRLPQPFPYQQCRLSGSRAEHSPAAGQFARIPVTPYVSGTRHPLRPAEKSDKVGVWGHVHVRPVSHAGPTNERGCHGRWTGGSSERSGRPRASVSSGSPRRWSRGPPIPTRTAAGTARFGGSRRPSAGRR
jgi:SAM-dependent methyltransferase